jgi:hypothetical protein
MGVRPGEDFRIVGIGHMAPAKSALPFEILLRDRLLRLSEELRQFGKLSREPVAFVIFSLPFDPLLRILSGLELTIFGKLILGLEPALGSAVALPLRSLRLVLEWSVSVIVILIIPGTVTSEAMGLVETPSAWRSISDLTLSGKLGKLLPEGRR